MVNEAELGGRLQALGFHVLEPSALPFEEQVAEFSGAEEVVAVAGAALTNIVFCRPGTCYSPDLNPIEMAFAKVKALLRAKALRTVAALWNALGDIADSISPDECRNSFRHASYFWSG